MINKKASIQEHAASTLTMSITDWVAFRIRIRRRACTSEKIERVRPLSIPSLFIHFFKCHAASEHVKFHPIYCAMPVIHSWPKRGKTRREQPVQKYTREHYSLLWGTSAAKRERPTDRPADNLQGWFATERPLQPFQLVHGAASSPTQWWARTKGVCGGCCAAGWFTPDMDGRRSGFGPVDAEWPML